MIPELSVPVRDLAHTAEGGAGKGCEVVIGGACELGGARFGIGRFRSYKTQSKRTLSLLNPHFTRHSVPHLQVQESYCGRCIILSPKLVPKQARDSTYYIQKDSQRHNLSRPYSHTERGPIAIVMPANIPGACCAQAIFMNDILMPNQKRCKTSKIVSSSSPLGVSADSLPLFAMDYSHFAVCTDDGIAAEGKEHHSSNSRRRRRHYRVVERDLVT